MTASPGKPARSMRIIFAGTPEFAQVALAGLLDAGHEVPLVLTQPDRPAGRGMKLQASPVKQFALARGLTVLQPRSLRLDGRYPDEAALAQQAILNCEADACVVAAYGLILPQWVLDAPRLQCFNIHASLLPRWRGAAPIHRAIEAGDAETGITIMQMDAGLDTGDMLLTQAVAITATDTTGSLHDRLSAVGSIAMLRVLEQAQLGELQPQVQAAEGVCYAHKIEKAEALIDWRLSAEVIGRRIRAFNPFPGAHTLLGADTLKVWACLADDASGPVGQSDLGGTGQSNTKPGTVLAVGPHALTVQTGQGQLALTSLQRAGGKRLELADFLRGFELRAGMVLG